MNFMFFTRTKVQESCPKSKSEYLTLCIKCTTNNKLSNICKRYDKKWYNMFNISESL